MITKENFKDVLEILGFKKENNDIYFKKFENQLELRVDFKKQALIYPQNIIKESDTTSNFSQNENFVVFECVNRLLEKGYKSEHLILEKTWTLGHSGKSGRADITVYDNDEKVLLIIECKTAGTEYNKARKKLFNDIDGKQLFSYATQARSVKWLQLYASDFDKENKNIKLYEEIIKIHDDENMEILSNKDDSILIYKNASETQDIFRVWEETYNKKTYQNLIFGKDSQAYKIGVKPLKKKDLKEFDKSDGVNIAFKEILRHNHISDKENAFNKLLSLFICKLVDEKQSKEEDEVKFQYKEGIDTYFSIYDRLLKLFHTGMKEFLKEEVYHIDENEYVPKTLKSFTGSESRKNLEKELKKTFRNTKLLSSQFFAFREIYNETLFLHNGKILVEIVELFQSYKLSYSSREQFLSDLFEQLIKEGFKQDEGQYFTPTPITRFVWNSLPFESFIKNTSKLPKVIDFACGAGHFLTEGISAIGDYLHIKGIKNTDEEISQNFYGIDKDNRLAKLSKVAMLLNGANEAKIQVMDGLEHNEEFYKGKLEDFYLKDQAFDILVANPPYSVESFKTHLNKRILKEFEVLDFISGINGKIENVFVERITHILKPKGIVAIVLPASILTNTDLATIKTREILLENFMISSVIFFGSKTFGATSIDTVILFLKRFDEPPKRKEQIKDSLEAILKNQNLENWEDKEILDAYLKLQNIPKEIYVDFINKEDFEPKSHPYFDEYQKFFLNLTEIKNHKNLKTFKNLSPQEQKQLLQKKFKEKILEIECEKLYFFALSYNQQTLIINTPNDIKEQKIFLGYIISDAKNKNAGLTEYENGLLTDKKNRWAEDKLSYFVKKSFDNEICSHESLNKYVKYAKTCYLLDFSLADFKKIINLNPPILVKGKIDKIQNIWENCKYELRALGEILKSEGKGKRPASFGNKQGTYPFVKSSKILDKCNEYDFDFEAIIIGDGGGANIHYMNEKFSSSDHTYIFSNQNKNSILLKFVYYIINSNLEILEQGFRGIALKNISKTYIQNLKIPLPPIEIQQKIVEECEKIEEQYQTIRMTIEEYQNLIKIILIKTGIIVEDSTNSEGGGATMKVA